MELPSFIPPELVPLFIGAVALAIGLRMVDMTNLIISLIGLVLALGGLSYMMSTIPSDWSWFPLGIRAIVVTLVFVGLSARIAFSGWPKNRTATIIGAVLTILGLVALWSQLGDYGRLPDGTVQDLIEEGLNALSRIFKSSSETID